MSGDPALRWPLEDHLRLEQVQNLLAGADAALWSAAEDFTEGDPERLIQATVGVGKALMALALIQAPTT